MPKIILMRDLIFFKRLGFFTLCILCAGLLFWPDTASANNKYASLVIDAETGKVLSSRHADKKLHPASLTKMMTIYMVFRELEAGRLSMNTRIPISKHAASMPPSKLGIKAGRSIRVEDAISLLVVKSHNDVAVAVGEKISGTESQFARDMTRVARAMGMSRTTFTNASGLPDRKQISTARDMAILARALLYHYPEHYRFFALQSYRYDGKTYTTHNRMLSSFKGMDGLKTGFINMSGFNLVASAKRDGRRLIGVVYGGRSWQTRNAHMEEIMNAGFNKIRGQRPYIQEVAYRATKPQEILGGTESNVARTQVVNSVAPGSNEWSIQIGAFSEHARSLSVANQKTAELKQRFGPSVRSNIVPFSSQQGTIYRARVTGLTQSEAVSACRTIASCLVVQPNG